MSTEIQENAHVLEKKFREYLLRNKMFYTKERALILESVLNREDHFSVDELLFEMQKTGQKVSRATLYRCLSQMVDATVLIEADFGHGHTHYEVNNAEAQHEHLVCVKCEKVIEVQNADYTEAVYSLARVEGFVLNSYKTQIMGVCKECQDK